ncbi:hypothetical protein ACFQ3J_08785 [Paenibacillus provencensis]|uniref:Uncharacterized protein n=1 Tax=Paenibacillus provencensis TaxID=441151 RepID=A0ABW3PWD2_9BACL|nr:hypothetical protein [Paenibacillus sp. MER 78]MCM3129014.1 hypothetical protein [Paenibacillus sp. MER 78]
MAMNDEAQATKTDAVDSKTTKLKQRTAKQEVTAPDQLIYIGPNVKKNGVQLRTSQVFKGGYPTHIETLYAEYPLLKSLFVPVDQYQAAKKTLKQTGSALNIAIRSLGVE